MSIILWDTKGKTYPTNYIYGGSGRTFTAGTPVGTGMSAELIIGDIVLNISAGAGFSNYQIRIQLEQSSTITAWEQSGSVIIFPMPSPLYSLSDGTADGYDLVSGQVMQRVGRMVLNGTENWGRPTCLDGLHHYFECNAATGSNNNFDQLCSSVAKCANPYAPTEEGATYDEDCFWVHSAHYRIRLASEPSLGDFKAMLAANPVTVLFGLANPLSSQIGEQKIPTCTPVSILFADRGSISAQYCQDMNKVLEKIENAILSLG